ncbi:MAG: DUF748 domain-containing protein [bacterium]|nr:DUF748 domain-containing protein [bacterium]
MNFKVLQPKNKWLKLLFSILLIITILVALVIVFISPIAKYLVQKYDTKYLGREIKVDWVYVNPFTGYIHLDNLEIYEAESDTVFLYASGLSVNFSMLKLLAKTYEISALKISNPRGFIIRNNNVFNFNDIIQKFSDKDTLDTLTAKDPLHFNLLNCEISEGAFYMSEPNTPINYSFLHVNFNSDGKYWDRDTINGNLSLQSGIGSGDVKLDFSINIKTLDYRFGAVVTNFNLGVMNQYLQDLASYGSLSGFINGNIKAKGNFNSKENIDGHGRIVINDFHFGKDSLTDYVSYKQLALAIIRLAPAHKKYLFDTIRLEEPYFKYEKYDELDNLQNMFGEKGAKVKEVKNNPEKFNLIITVSQYIQTLFKNFFKSDYKINSLAVVDANLVFNDFSVSEKFSTSLNPLNIKSDSVSNKNKLVRVYLKSGIKPYGFLTVNISVDPSTNKDFDLHYKLQKVSASQFNPYVISYTSFPLDRGTLELFGNWQVRNDLIKSNNHLIVVDPRLSKRIRKQDAQWLPVPLAFLFVRERGNVIDYEIPISGNLKDPKFHYMDPIMDALKNIFVKPATTPYRFEVKNLETEIEKSQALAWFRRQAQLNIGQENFLNKISDFLKENPSASILVQPVTYAEKEKEYILFFEAKKKYYLLRKGKTEKFLTKQDSLAVERLSVKDPSFIKYLNKHLTDSLLFTVQEKCYSLVGEAFINGEFNKLKNSRTQAFKAYFDEAGTGKQIKIVSNKNGIPFNGLSSFELHYKGKIPEALLEAYQQLNAYNLVAPRDKYRAFRKK